MENIGIEPKQLIMQLINFTLMIVILTKLLYKPIIKILEERKKKIEDGLDAASKNQEELDRTEKKRQDVLAKAREEGKQIIEETKKNAKLVEAEIIRKAQEEGAIIIERGKKDLASEREQMRNELRKETIDIAAQLTEKVLGKILTSSDQKQLLEKRIKDLHGLIQ